MAKAKKTVFFCQECGYESPKWMGQCPGCKSWNTFVEETVSPNQTKHQEATGCLTPDMERSVWESAGISGSRRLHGVWL